MRLTWPNLKHFHTNVLYRPVAGVLTTIHVFYSTLCRLLQSLLYISVVLLSGHLWYTEFPPCARNSLCFTSSCWNQHLGALCAGLMKSFMLWLNQMIRGWADGASKRNRVHRREGSNRSVTQSSQTGQPQITDHLKHSVATGAGPDTKTQSILTCWKWEPILHAQYCTHYVSHKTECTKLNLGAELKRQIQNRRWEQSTQQYIFNQGCT